MSNTKAENRTIPPVNLMLVGIYNHIILILGESVLLGEFKLEDEVVDVYGVDGKM